MRRFKNVNEITEENLQTINNCLVKFDKYLRDVTKMPIDENVALYEHWVDCSGDIEDMILVELD